MFVKIFLCITLLSSFRQALSQNPRIAIVGSGIGGTSCSYFLEEGLNGNVEIDIYEANEIGGRLATMKYKDGIYETGGYAFLRRNKYINMFRNKFNLKKFWDPNTDVILRDASGTQSFSGKSLIITPLKVVWKFGLSPICRLRRFIHSVFDKCDRIYKLQEYGYAYSSVELLFAAIDQNLKDYFKISAYDGMCSYVNANKKIIDDVVYSTMRMNYGQGTDAHLFLGLVSVSGQFFSSAGILGGNEQIPRLLLQASVAKFCNRRVYKIIFDETKKEYIVESVAQDNQKFTKKYDVVIIAYPITADSETPIEFVNFNPPITVPGQYQKLVTTFVAGKLQPKHYNLSKNQIPDAIFENGDSVIMMISKAWPVDVKEKMKPPLVWKILSRRALTDNELKPMFETPEVVDVREWLACPKYENLSVKDAKFVLHDRLFYVNAIEWAASAMEMSIIGAKNVANLVKRELQPKKNCLNDV